MFEPWKSIFCRISEDVQKLIVRSTLQLLPTEEGSCIYDSYHNARMSYTRLKALEGIGHRQCYMDKLRNEAAPRTGTDRWSRFAERQTIENPVLADERRRRERFYRAQQRQSLNRLEALVSRMSPEQFAANEQEGKRLQGSSWQIPRATRNSA